MKRQFPAIVRKALKNYVYLYVDPEDGEIFYIGKGVGDRAFAHLTESEHSDKTARIAEIRARGKQPLIEILCHGMETAEEAHTVEAAAIELLGRARLTNAVGGHTRGRGRMAVERIIQLYDRQPVQIQEPAVLIRINQFYRSDMSPIELYDFTRGVWRIGPQRDTVQYALAVFEGIVVEVYFILAWLPAGTTLSSRGDLTDPDRYEFIGQVAPSEIRDKYMGKSVDAYFTLSNQNPIRYVNVAGPPA